MELLGIDLTLEEFDYLMCEQAKGKELKLIDGKVVAVERVITEKEKAQMELNKLKQWFDVEYMRQEQKLRRLHTLGKDYNGISAYDKLIELYNQAEEVRAKINQLEVIIGN